MALDYTFVSSVLLGTKFDTLREEYQNAVREAFKSNAISKVQIPFNVYLESQIHYNVVARTNNRSVEDYNNAYNYMINVSDDSKSYLKVLKYYYKDLSDLIFALDLNQIPDFSIVGNQNIPRCEELGFNYISRLKVKNCLELARKENNVVVDNIDFVQVAGSAPVSHATCGHYTLVAEGSLLRYLANLNTDLNIIWR